MANAELIPAFVNPEAGTAEKARDALSAAGLFDVREVPPAELEKELRAAVDAGAKRVVIAGGDGSIRSAAAVVAEKGIELGIIPAGTLNHFARDHGIPEDPADAARVAGGEGLASADAAFVGDSLFLNTSSIGAYVVFMRVRERLEARLGYKAASLIAMLRTFFIMRTVTVELEIDGKRATYRSPIVFIGVGERELRMPKLGSRTDGGRRGLHVLIVRGRRKGRLLLLALEAVSRGLKSAAASPQLDSFIVDRCTLRTGRRHATISLDGELNLVELPLNYRIERDILRITRDERESPANP